VFVMGVSFKNLTVTNCGTGMRVASGPVKVEEFKASRCQTAIRTNSDSDFDVRNAVVDHCEIGIFVEEHAGYDSLRSKFGIPDEFDNEEIRNDARTIGGISPEDLEGRETYLTTRPIGRWATENAISLGQLVTALAQLAVALPD